MRKAVPAVLIAGFVLAAVLVPPVSGQGGAPKIVVLPKGTAVQSLAEGHFRLKLPDGCCLELKGYQKRTGTATVEAAGSAAECCIRDAKGKLVALGGEVRIVGGPTPTGVSSAGEAAAGDYLKIDGETTWLPARIEFQATRVFNRLALLKLAPAEEVAK